MTVFGFGGDPFDNSIGDSFFSGLFSMFPIIFMVVFGLIIFMFVKTIFHHSKTSSTLKDLQQFASQLADDPNDDTAERLADFLRGVDSFSIERTRMEPFRVALGCYQMVMESRSVREETKEQLDRQYKRLGILDGEKFADEAPPRRRSSSSNHHDIHHNHHDHM